jgi:hypothetical protein
VTAIIGRAALVAGTAALVVFAACSEYKADESEVVDAGTDAGKSKDAGADTSLDPTPTDAGTDASDPSCPANATFCDGFEKGLGNWLLAVKKTTVETVPEGAGNELRVKADEVSGSASEPIVGTVSRSFSIGFPETFALRARVRISQVETNARLRLLSISGLKDGTPSFEQSIVRLDDGWRLRVANAGEGTSDHDMTTPTPPPIDAWTCLELDVGVGFDPTGYANLFVDDALVVNTGISTDNAQLVSLMSATVGIYTELGGTTIARFDDVIVARFPGTQTQDTPRIGCKSTSR